MARVYDNAYWTGEAGYRSGSNHIAKQLGPTGKYSGVHNFTGGELYLTGSMYGFGPISINISKATASLYDGGQVFTDALNTGEIHEFATYYISASAGTCDINVYKLSEF